MELTTAPPSSYGRAITSYLHEELLRYTKTNTTQCTVGKHVDISAPSAYQLFFLLNKLFRRQSGSFGISILRVLELKKKKFGLNICPHQVPLPPPPPSTVVVQYWTVQIFCKCSISLLIVIDNHMIINLTISEGICTQQLTSWCVSALHSQISDSTAFTEVCYDCSNTTSHQQYWL